MWAAMRARFTPKQMAGAVAMTGAFGVTVAVAVLGSSKSPPSTAGAAALVVLAAALQIGGAWAFSARPKAPGTANADHAEASVQNLLRLFIKVQAVKALAEKAGRKRTADVVELKAALGEISVQSETLYERTEDAVGHWAQFYPQAVEEAKRKAKEAGNG